MRLLVQSQIINLHPEIELLIAIALESSRFAISRSYARANFHRANHKITAANRFGGNRLHLVSDNE